MARTSGRACAFTLNVANGLVPVVGWCAVRRAMNDTRQELPARRWTSRAALEQEGALVAVLHGGPADRVGAPGLALDLNDDHARLVEAIPSVAPR